jgi:hypothetical protein
LLINDSGVVSVLGGVQGVQQRVLKIKFKQLPVKGSPIALPFKLILKSADFSFYWRIYKVIDGTYLPA